MYDDVLFRLTTVCSHEVSMVKSTLKTHLISQKHKDSKSANRSRAGERKQTLIDGNAYLTANKTSGSTLPDDVLVFRLQVLKTFMSGGVPISKIDHFRSLLEEGGQRLTGRQHLADFVPLIRDKERELVKRFISGRPISIIFDGTTTTAEAMAIIFRFVDDNFNVQQRLAALKLAGCAMSGEQVAHTLLSVLSLTYSVQPHDLIASMRDRASVNDCAVRTIKVLYTNIMDVGCFSHTLAHVGDKISADDAKLFTSMWVQLFAHSPKCRLEWKARANVSVRSYSKTRWWSKWQVMEQLHDLFGDVVEFLLATPQSDSSVTRRRLKEKVQGLESRARLQMQLAVVVKFGRPFADSTYRVEGDGALCVQAYQGLTALSLFVNANPLNLPSTSAVARGLAAGNGNHETTWMDFALQCPYLLQLSISTTSSVKVVPITAASKHLRHVDYSTPSHWMQFAQPQRTLQQSQHSRSSPLLM